MKSAPCFARAPGARRGSWRRSVQVAMRLPNRSTLAATLLALAVLVPASAGTADAFRDPLDTPAETNKLAATSALLSVAKAGNRLVAVGLRGLITISDDAGVSWKQRPAPVSSDLVAVRFVTPTQGFASGHDGVLLSTQDGGNTWVKRLDGRMAAALLIQHFTRAAAAGDQQAVRLLAEVRRNYAEGPEIPLLDVWFDTPERGWVVGAFGTILGTEDGGKHWSSWIEKVDNDQMLHYNAMRRIGGELYVASEKGVVFKLDRQRGRFVALQTGYQGSFFGLIGTSDYVLAYGLRGTLYRSRDGGSSWQALKSGVNGGLNSGIVTEGGSIVLGSQDGRVVVSRDQGDSFTAMVLSRPDLITGIAVAPSGKAVVAGLRGAQIVTID